MGLVDYSDSESDSEPVAPVPVAPVSAATTSSGAKKPFQKVVDRAKPGKILVNLPSASGTADDNATAQDEPPSKRAKTSGGGAFKGFNSFLPPPKNVGKSTSSNNSSSKKIAPPPGVNLKTSATAGFNRDTLGEDDEGSEANPQQPQPTIPSEQKPVDEVKITGKPLMFKPLSVSRKPGAKKIPNKIPGAPPKSTAPNPKPSLSATASGTTSNNSESPAPATAQPAAEELGPPKKKKKMSLFGISDDASGSNSTETASSSSGNYEPMFEDPVATHQAFAQYDAQYGSGFGDPSSYSTAAPTAEQIPNNPDSLDAVAASMNLSAAERRELFGRQGLGAAGGNTNVAKLVNFSADDEWAANEALRASGQLQPAFNPVKAIAPGKHSLTQLVRQVHSQKDALEESFAKNKSTKNEAGARYGWR